MRTLLLALMIAVFIPASASAITITLHFDWSCTGTYGTTVVTGNPDGTFTTDDGFSGTWGIFGGVAHLKYEDGCCPLYVFSLATADGQHKCTDGAQMCTENPGCDYYTFGGVTNGSPVDGGGYNVVGQYVGPMTE